MRIDLDAKVVTRDGEHVGSVERAVVDPDTNRVTDFVIGTGWLFGRDILVPSDELERAERDGEAVRLALNKAELEALPNFVPAQYMSPPEGWIPDAGYIFPGTYLWPQTPAYIADAMPTADQADQPISEVSIGKGATVFDRDGDDLGAVEEVRLDPATGELEGIVVRVGGVLAHRIQLIPG